MSTASPVRIHKFTPEGKHVFDYEVALLLEQGAFRLVEGWFMVPERQVDRLILRTGDRFVEVYFSDRFYNIYEVYDQDSHHIKAWYCNISKPAEFTLTEIRWVDLALDLLVFPDGYMALLDQDEFAALPIDLDTRRQCWLAVQELMALFKGRVPS